MNSIALLLALLVHQSNNMILTIEVGGKGPKLMLVSENYKPLFINSVSASPLKDSANGIMTADSMAETTVAIVELFLKAKKLAKERKWVIKHEIIVASSSISEAKNSKTLYAKIENLTGLKVFSITAQDEARFIFQAIIPTTKKHSACLVDIGSGNARVAYLNENTLKEITIPLGTVTATNLMKDLEKSVFESKIRDLVKISLPKKEEVYVTGGIVWALQCLVKPPTELYTPIDILKIKMLDLSAEFTKATKTEQQLIKVFTRSNLIAGAHLFFAILNNFPEDQEIIFVNNRESWLIEFLIEQAGNK